MLHTPDSVVTVIVYGNVLFSTRFYSLVNATKIFHIFTWLHLTESIFKLNNRNFCCEHSHKCIWEISSFIRFPRNGNHGHNGKWTERILCNQLFDILHVLWIEEIQMICSNGKTKNFLRMDDSNLICQLESTNSFELWIKCSLRSYITFCRI